MTPFAFEDQLDKSLSITSGPKPVLNGKPNGKGIISLPSHPLIDSNDAHGVRRFIHSDLETTKLDDLSRFFFFVASPSSSNILPLHAQRARGRHTVVSQNPGLHLLWQSGRVYIKPLPAYLCSHVIWAHYLDINPELWKLAVGFIRSYAYLIQTDLDFSLALEEKLLPGLKDDDFERLMIFLDSFKTVPDANVYPRYRYGDLRLSRVNNVARAFRFRMFYHETYDEYGQLFSKFLAPFVFVFGTVSVSLTAMQVVTAVEQIDADGDWKAFMAVSRWFSVGCIVLVAGTLALFPLLWGGFLLNELFWAVKLSVRKKRARI